MAVVCERNHVGIAKVWNDSWESILAAQLTYKIHIHIYEHKRGSISCTSEWCIHTNITDSSDDTDSTGSTDGTGGTNDTDGGDGTDGNCSTDSGADADSPESTDSADGTDGGDDIDNTEMIATAGSDARCNEIPLDLVEKNNM